MLNMRSTLGLILAVAAVALGAAADARSSGQDGIEGGIHHPGGGGDRAKQLVMRQLAGGRPGRDRLVRIIGHDDPFCLAHETFALGLKPQAGPLRASRAAFCPETGQVATRFPRARVTFPWPPGFGLLPMWYKGLRPLS